MLTAHGNRSVTPREKNFSISCSFSETLVKNGKKGQEKNQPEKVGVTDLDGVLTDFKASFTVIECDCGSDIPKKWVVRKSNIALSLTCGKGHKKISPL